MSRLVVLKIVVLIVLTIMVGRLYQLQLVDSDARRYGSSNIQVTTTRYVMVAPRRGEILASDGKTLLAESVSIYSIAVLPGGLPPVGSQSRSQSLGKLAQISGMTATLTLSSSQELQYLPALQEELSHIDLHLAPQTLTATLDVAPMHILETLRMSDVYSDVLTFNNPIDAMISRSSTRGYETLIVKEDVPSSLALVIHENSSHLPGVVVVEEYRRRYPQSNSLPSLSHLLGYIGRINSCELITENPSSSWLTSLVDVVSSAPTCRIVEKKIMYGLVGTPLYKHDDRIGKDGLEASYEEELRGKIGIQMIGVDALERPVSTPRMVQAVEEGHNLVLTIDLEFQRQVQIILQRWINESEARRATANDHRHEYKPITNGVAVVLNVRDGRVLASVSLPAYDNNVWVEPARLAELQNLLSPADPARQEELARLSPLTNRVITGQYPPGSSLKQFVGAIALQKGIIQPDSKLRDPGRLTLQEQGGHIFELPNSSSRDNGLINVSDALKVSSNVFFASVSGGNDQAINLGRDAPILHGMGISELAAGMEWFGFGHLTGIRLPAEATGRVPTPNWKAHTLREPWTTGDTYNTSIGQGYMDVTPLQLVVGTAATANGGTVYRPQLVQRIVNADGSVVQEFAPEIVAQVPISSTYLAVIRDGMRRSVTEGLNVAARDDCSGLSIAGKTGTAEFGPVVSTAQGKLTRQSHSWFAGFAPYDNPEIAVVVLLEGTGDLGDGSTTLAVPAVTQIMQAYFHSTPPEERPRDCPVLPQ